MLSKKKTSHEKISKCNKIINSITPANRKEVTLTLVLAQFNRGERVDAAAPKLLPLLIRAAS